MRSPIETKVITAATGSGLASAAGTFILWLLGVVLWHVPDTAGHAAEALGAVPTPVAAVVGICVTVGGTFLAGYVAPHTDRPDLALPLELRYAPAVINDAAAEAVQPLPPVTAADPIAADDGPTPTTSTAITFTRAGA